MKYIKTFEAKKPQKPGTPKAVDLTAYHQKIIKAAQSGNGNKIKELLLMGLDINETDSGGRTALMWATTKCFPVVVDILIKAGADVNLHDNDGYTALMKATTKLIRNKLLDAGAIDIDIEDFKMSKKYNL